MTLREIREALDNAPTMMSVAEELKYIQQLMQIPAQKVQAEPSEFAAIMDRLSESHMEAVFDVTEETLPAFLAFSDWLDQLATAAVSEVDRKAKRSFAQHFRIDPRAIRT